MARAIGLFLMVGGVALVLLDLFVFNEPKAALKAGPVNVTVKGDASLGTVSIVGAVCFGLGLIAMFFGSRPAG